MIKIKERCYNCGRYLNQNQAYHAEIILESPKGTDDYFIKSFCDMICYQSKLIKNIKASCIYDLNQ